MEEFARKTPRIPTFLLDPTILTRTRFPRWKLGHVRAQLASLSPPDASFLKFSKLPTEIRLKIWRYALPGRRRIAINKTKLRDREFVKSYYEVYPYEPSPAVLFVCPESREVALRFYHKLLTRVEGGLSGGTVYMDFEVDVLYLDDVVMTWAMNFPGIEHDLSRIKHIALRGRTALFPCSIPNLNGQPFYPTWLLEPFHSLESLFIDDRARHSLPSMNSILAGLPIDRTRTTVPVVSGIAGHRQWRFHHIWLRVAQFNREDQIEESWLRYEREREEMEYEKVMNLPAWSKMYVPLARLGL
ncbi:hypothetical protein DL98DRAFT_589274 [Cadophora sp. DSE1049]|nr:hypothetical protein DL98DRAFT_589274 [Cadophora sp. DSE1049]